jgi:CRISPR system Cascade subunit CasB
MNTLLERLRKYQDNRGMMANLRCILVENKKHRAWPVLHRLGVRMDDDVAAFVAGLFATHPETSGQGNFGVTCKIIEQRRGEKSSDDSKLTTTERRFQHLLAASGKAEAFERVKRMVLMAKAQGTPINYAVLLHDLKYWSDRIKADWANAFWAPEADTINKEEA